MTTGRTTVVVATYNRVSLLAETVRSVRAQATAPALVVVDDCSADGTAEYLAGLSDVVAIVLLGGRARRAPRCVVEVRLHPRQLPARARPDPGFALSWGDAFSEDTKGVQCAATTTADPVERQLVTGLAARTG